MWYKHTKGLEGYHDDHLKTWKCFLEVHLRYPRCARTSRSQCDCRERTTTGRGSWLGNTSSWDTWILFTDTTISLHSSPVILMWITKWFFRKQFLVSTLGIFIVWNIFESAAASFTVITRSTARPCHPLELIHHFVIFDSNKSISGFSSAAAAWTCPLQCSRARHCAQGRVSLLKSGFLHFTIPPHFLICCFYITEIILLLDS